jgi:ubiquinone/menaquinone biosynthesis C-methylase UbiE
MKLNADFTAVDLSETMLVQGMRSMSEKGEAVDFALADAAALPFVSNAFDVVTNYGAVNGMTDPGGAIREMVRVAKPGGYIVFLDEQLYNAASHIERIYFNTVLSSHNVVHMCPVHLFPEAIDGAEVLQVYQFYYLCVAVKRPVGTKIA